MILDDLAMRIPFRGITADRLRSYGIPDKAIRKMTFREADEILTAKMMEEAEPPRKPKTFCGMCGKVIDECREDIMRMDGEYICNDCFRRTVGQCK